MLSIRFLSNIWINLYGYQLLSVSVCKCGLWLLFYYSWARSRHIDTVWMASESLYQEIDITNQLVCMVCHLVLLLLVFTLCIHSTDKTLIILQSEMWFWLWHRIINDIVMLEQLHVTSLWHCPNFPICFLLPRQFPW